MDVDSPLNVLCRQAQLVWVKCLGQEIVCGQEHDKSCKKFKAQELVECILQSLVDIRMVQPLNDWEKAYIIGRVTNELDQRESLPEAAEDIANISGAMEFVLQPCFRADVWTPACGHLHGWDDPVEETPEYGIRFSFPAATSFFIYRQACFGDQDVCACANAPGVKESGLHVWLYVHQDENGKSYRWITQAEVKAWALQESAVLSEHLIYQRSSPRSSDGPPMLRCTHGQGTVPEFVWMAPYDLEEGEEMWEDREPVWQRSEPAAICAQRYCRAALSRFGRYRKQFVTSAYGE